MHIAIKVRDNPFPTSFGVSLVWFLTAFLDKASAVSGLALSPLHTVCLGAVYGFSQQLIALLFGAVFQVFVHIVVGYFRG